MALLGLTVLTLVAVFGESALRTKVEANLRAALQRRVTLGGLSVSLPRREIELRDLAIPGLPDSKRPSAIVPKARIAFSLRSLLSSRLLLRRLELDRPRLSVEVFPDGTTDLPTMAAGGSSPAEILIEAFEAKSGELYVNERRVPLNLELPNLEMRVLRDRSGLLKGSLSAGPGPIGFGALPLQQASIEVAARLEGSRIFVEQGQFKAGATNLAIEGDVDLRAQPKGELRLNGPFDLESFDRSVADTGLGLKGRAQVRAKVAIAPEKVLLTASLRGVEGEYDSIPVEKFATDLSFDGSLLRLTNLSIEAFSGSAAFAIDSPAGKPVRVSGRLDGVAADPLLHWLFKWGATGFGSRASGPLDLTLPRGAASHFTGSGDLTLAADALLGDALSGRLAFKAENGNVILSESTLSAPSTMVTIAGSIANDQRIAMQVKLITEDIEVTDAQGVRVRRAIGAPNPAALGAKGRGVFEGRAVGTLGDPVFPGQFQGSGVRYLGVDWGDIDWTGSASPMDLTTERLLARRGASRVEFHGKQRLGPKGVDDQVNLQIALSGWPAKDVLRVVDSTLDLDSLLTGDVRLEGSMSRPSGTAAFKSGDGVAYGVKFKDGNARLRFMGDSVDIESLDATVGGGDLHIKGAMSEVAGVRSFDGAVDVREVELEDLGLQPGSGPVVGGHVSGRVTLSGPVEKPYLVAHLESRRIFYGDEGIGAATVEVKGDGAGQMTVTGKSESSRFNASATGTLEAKSPHVAHLDVHFSDIRLDPVLRARGSKFQTTVVVTASARALIDGPLADPAALSVRVREGHLRIAVPEYAIETGPDVAVDIEHGEMRISGLSLTGDGTALSLAGKVALTATDLNDLSIAGRADLRVLSAFSRDWRARGSARLRAQITGRPDALRVAGGLDIENGALRLRSFPQGLDGLNGRIVFSETQARVAGLEGRFGGGRVSVSGEVGFGGLAPASFDLSLSGEALGLRYPAGLSSTFSGSLRLLGTADSHWLTGDLLVSRAVWTRPYDIATQLLSSQAVSAGLLRPASGLRQAPMHLDIAIKAPGTLRLDNNLATLVARADLSLTGSPAEPQLLGKAEIERGKVFFQGNTYDIRKGVASFSNPREINPVFDIEADTRVRSYRLTLIANGTVDRVSTRITSDPPLTSLQIASLLTGADENTVVNASGRNEQLGNIAIGGVGLAASSWVSDNLTGRFGKGFGLSRLSIQPETQTLTKGARLTVGKRVTSNLEVVYSRNILGGVDLDLATAEYSLSNRFSLVLSRANPGGTGIDARARFTFNR